MRVLVLPILFCLVCWGLYVAAKPGRDL